MSWDSRAGKELRDSLVLPSARIASRPLPVGLGEEGLCSK